MLGGGLPGIPLSSSARHSSVLIWCRFFFYFSESSIAAPPGTFDVTATNTVGVGQQPTPTNQLPKKPEGSTGKGGSGSAANGSKPVSVPLLETAIIITFIQIILSWAGSIKSLIFVGFSQKMELQPPHLRIPRKSKWLIYLPKEKIKCGFESLKSSSTKRPCRNKRSLSIWSEGTYFELFNCESIQLMHFLPMLLQPRTLLMRLMHVNVRSRHYTRQKTHKLLVVVAPRPARDFLFTRCVWRNWFEEGSTDSD